MIVAKNLGFSYGSLRVFRSVSFSITSKEIVAVVGPNGAGKTTLIKCILGFLDPQEGSVLISGTKPNDVKSWRHVGYVPQRFSIDSQFPGTVREILKSTSLNQKDDCCHLGVDKLLNKKFVELSGGQQQKVLIAQALQSDPQLLILDEPTVGIDQSSQKEFYSLLTHLHKMHNMTILVVTHDISHIPSYATKVLVINETLKYFGPVKNIAALHEVLH